jgi:hypothetical protein
LRSHNESDPPPGPFPVLPSNEAHPIQRDPESPNACQASLFGAPPAGVRVTSLRLDYLPRQARLIVFQAFPNENLKPVVILGKLVRRLISLRLVGLHFRYPNPNSLPSETSFPRTRRRTPGMGFERSSLWVALKRKDIRPMFAYLPGNSCTRLSRDPAV